MDIIEQLGKALKDQEHRELTDGPYLGPRICKACKIRFSGDDEVIEHYSRAHPGLDIEWLFNTGKSEDDD